jgi:hypothetical protein
MVLFPIVSLEGFKFYILITKEIYIFFYIHSRDAIIYALSCQRSGLREILGLLAETINRPIFSDSEVSFQDLFFINYIFKIFV